MSDLSFHSFSTSLGYDRKSYEVAKAASFRFKKESDVLQYLIDSRPPCLHTGDFLSVVDKQMLDKRTKGVSDKFRIHGYPDRGERLLYLHSVLSSKLEKNKDMLTTVVNFLLDMSERPTSVVTLHIGNETYSRAPDNEMNDDKKGSEIRNKELLKEILNDTEHLETISHLIFSSDSELSEWTSDEEESETSKKSTNDIVEPDRNLKASKSFSDFVSLQFYKDNEDTQQQMKLYWSMEAIQAQNFLIEDLRKTNIKALKSQPIISSLIALHSKFGEHWELNKQSKELNVVYSIISEEDVIREILWQFSSLNTVSSSLFTLDWKVKPNLMISSISRMSFASFIEPYETTFQILAKFKRFIDQLEYSALSSELAVPKMLRSYAKGLSEIMIYISEEVGGIERNLKIKNKWNLTTSPQPCTTLIQLKRQLNLYLDCVVMLDRIHVLSVDSTVTAEGDLTNRWFCSLRLLSSLGVHLNLQTQPVKFGIVFFLFCKCLHAFLDEINLAMSTLTWNENHLLFVRSKDIKLSDHSFWTDSIKQRPYEARMIESGIPAVTCIAELIPEILIVLKTSEMLRQLEEDYVKILGTPPLANQIIEDFVERIFSESSSKITPCLKNDIIPDYKTHFRFIGLEGSVVADSVKHILKQDINNFGSQRPKNFLNRFIFLNEIPNVNSWEVLDCTLTAWYGPHCDRAKNCMKKIFQDYRVDESLKIFREIILGAREDFAKCVVGLSLKINTSKRFQYEDVMNRNPNFQKLLIDCYPEGRENFDIEFKLDRTCDVNYALVVKPHFPLNLILTDDSIDGYLFVSRQLNRIRKSLWEVTALSMKDFKTVEDVEPNRAFLFRFALIHFCSSIRAYLVFKIFAKDHSNAANTHSYDLDDIRKAHRDHLLDIETKLLRSPVMENVVIRKMASMSEALSKFWTRGIPSKSMILLEDTLKKCWNVVRTFNQSNYSTDFNELSYHFGSAPSYL